MPAPPSASARSRSRAASASERTRLADPLQLSQEVLRHLPSGVVFFDRQGCVSEANPAARAALGLAAPRGLTLAALFRDAELREPDGTLLGRADALMADIYKTNRILQRKTLTYTTPDGSSRRLGVTLFPLRQQDETTALICLLTDLTAIHVLEEELQRRKNLSALGEMAAGIAHEFKNSLATISGYAQMLHASLEGVERAQTGKILDQVSMLNNIATEFLTFARPLAVQPEPVDLARLLHECADAIRVQDFPQVSIEIDDALPRIAGDPALLTYAVMNLLRNSCEAITQQRRGSRVEVRGGGLQDGQVRVLFTDDGPGVAAEVADKIFIPFFTTKASGTGLGLAMVHKIITAHQGSVLLADSAPGHTVFAVLLPAAPTPSLPPAGTRHGIHSSG